MLSKTAHTFPHLSQEYTNYGRRPGERDNPRKAFVRKDVHYTQVLYNPTHTKHNT
jgi:hypothetical protein